MNDHQRAIDLITDSVVEGISAADQPWLDRHLAGCPECSLYAESVGIVQSSLRAVAVMASDELVAATQARLRIHMVESRERVARVMLLSLSALLCGAASVASIAYLWPAVQWIVARYNLPAYVVGSGFALTWFLPATLVALLALAWRPGRAPAHTALEQPVDESY